MKKYIVIATLLAAGSAFASTEEWSFENVTPKSYDCATVNGFIFNLSSSLLTSVDNQNPLDEAVLLDGIDVWWTTSSHNKGVGVETRFVLTDESNVILAVAASSATSQRNGVESVDFGGVQISTDTTYRVWTATPSDSYSAGDVLSSNNIINTVGLKFAKYDSTQNKGLAIINSSVGQDGTVSLWDTWAPVVSINVSSIPEPSAFGLLAGLGALALVASRRRRR